MNPRLCHILLTGELCALSSRSHSAGHSTGDNGHAIIVVVGSTNPGNRLLAGAAWCPTALIGYVSGDHDSHQSRERPCYSGLRRKDKLNFLTMTHTR